MPSLLPRALQRLYDLDKSSSQFHDNIYDILHRDDYRKCVYVDGYLNRVSGEEYQGPVLCLQGDDLVSLVDYLDTVRRPAALPHATSFTSAQALGVLSSSSSAFRVSLRELRKICGAGGILPTSYPISNDHLMVDSTPFAEGGYGDVYGGTFGGSRVCVKRTRVYIRDGPEKAVKVRLHCRFPRSPSSTKLVDILLGGRNVEAYETPKRPSPTWHHYQSLPTHFELDAWWGIVEIPQDEPHCRSTQIGSCPSSRVYPPPLTPAASCPASLTASVTYIPAM